MTTLYLGVFVLLVAFVLFLVSGRQRRASGLPGGRVVYTDTRAWGAVEKPLYDAEIGLTGKPDYLIEQGGRFIPVEVKTGRTPEAPYDSHIFQLAAYCYLVEKTYAKRPVEYTSELENALLDLLADIRMDERRSVVHRSHEDERRCQRCGYRNTCDQVLR